MKANIRGILDGGPALTESATFVDPPDRLKGKPALAFADQLRAAREAALRDSEAFDEIIHSIERLGCFLTLRCSGLGEYRDELEKIALRSALAEEVPKLCRGALTPFSRRYNLVKDARNDALHQGAFARHLTSQVIELALILEDALRSSERISDYMVRNPLFAELWQPVGFIRQQMLANSFSFLPVPHGEDWCLLSDRQVAIYLRTVSSNCERNRRLATPVDKTGVTLPTAECVKEEASLQDALKTLKDAPWLVCGEGIPGTPKRLLGIVTAFDLL